MIEQRIADVVARHTRDIADFPSPGVVFKDLTPLFADPAAFGQVLDLLAERHDGVDVVAGVEARGFIIGAPLAQRMGVGFVPIRKKGKLPVTSSPPPMTSSTARRRSRCRRTR